MLDSAQRAAAEMNCHLLVPDLLWPAAAGREPYRGLALPALETLLGRGRRTKLPGRSMERWFTGAYRIGSQHDLPLAPLSLRGDGGEPGNDWWLQADPVHLKVHGDRLILAEASRFTIARDEAQQFIITLNSHFGGEGILFVAPQPQRWYARVKTRPRMHTAPTGEMAGRSVERFLPAGDDGARWRSALNEIQMLLHEHPCNQAREARGELPVNGAWLWGAGRTPQVASGTAFAAVWSDHPLAKGLALASGVTPHPLPATGSGLLADLEGGPGGEALLVALAPLPGMAYGDMAAWRGAVLALERDWVSPLLAAAQNARIEITLHALGPDFGFVCEYSRRDHFRFWRRRRSLAAYAE